MRRGFLIGPAWTSKTWYQDAARSARMTPLLDPAALPWPSVLVSYGPQPRPHHCLGNSRHDIHPGGSGQRARLRSGRCPHRAVSGAVHRGILPAALDCFRQLLPCSRTSNTDSIHRDSVRLSRHTVRRGLRPRAVSLAIPGRDRRPASANGYPGPHTARSGQANTPSFRSRRCSPPFWRAAALSSISSGVRCILLGARACCRRHPCPPIPGGGQRVLSNQRPLCQCTGPIARRCVRLQHCRDAGPPCF
jgi:hypothetical protein